MRRLKMLKKKLVAQRIFTALLILLFLGDAIGFVYMVENKITLVVDLSVFTTMIFGFYLLGVGIVASMMRSQDIRQEMTAD